MDRCHPAVPGKAHLGGGGGNHCWLSIALLVSCWTWHGLQGQPFELVSLLPLTPPLSTVCFILQRQHIHLKLLQWRRKRMLPFPSPVWKQRKGRALWKGPRQLVAARRRRPGLLDEAWIKQHTPREKRFRLQHYKFRLEPEYIAHWGIKIKTQSKIKLS